MKAIVAALAIGQTGVAARKFWTSKPADPGNVLMTGYTIGNGRQGGKEIEDSGSDYSWLINVRVGLPLGIPGDDLLCLNDDSVWRGGPFSNSVRYTYQ